MTLVSWNDELLKWRVFDRGIDADGIVHVVCIAESPIQFWSCMDLPITADWETTRAPVSCIVCLAHAPTITEK